LAISLARLWALVESQSTARSVSYYDAVRSVRFNVVQRRRICFDVINTQMVCMDDRQEIFDKFTASFNSFSDNLRFDPDIIAELHLQTVELGDTLYQLCATRKAKLEESIQSMSNDAANKVAIHRVRCEAAALIESHASRFFVALHLLFDCSKSAKTFAYNNKVGNELEVTLPVTLPPEGSGGGVAVVDKGKGGKGDKDAGKDKGGKGKDKGEKVSSIVAFREPVSTILLPLDVMTALPEAKDISKEENVDPKAKGKKVCIVGVSFWFLNVY
jgi:hypothetical protein